MNALTADRLRELLHYDPLTGLFTRRTATGGKHAGSVCGAPQNMGYVQVMVDKGNYLAHRLAWLYMTGEWPSEHIDHIDGVRTNNVFSNLRDASRQVNAQNLRQAHSDNKTKVLGVSYQADRKRYAANIWHGGRCRHLGRFRTLEEASEAYLKAKRELHDGCTL